MSKTEKPIACPPKEEISKALRVLSDQLLHVYQIMWFAGIPCLRGPLKVERKQEGTILSFWIKVYHVDNPDLYFFANGSEPDEEILKKARMLLDGKKEKISARACCCYAVKQACVCIESSTCPLHGTKCYGSHD